MRLVVQRLDQKIDRKLALRLRVIIQRGQLRIGNFRIDTVVDADDADIFGNLAAAVEQRTQTAGRGEVNRIDDAVDRRVLAEDLLRDLIAGGVAGCRFIDFVLRIAERADPRQKALSFVAVCGGVRVIYIDDVLPALPCQKRHAVCYAAFLVGDDSRDVRKVNVAVDDDDRNVRQIGFDRVIGALCHEHRADERNALHAPLLELPDARADVRLVRAGTHDDRAVSPLCKLLLNGEGVVDMVHDTDIDQKDPNHLRRLHHKPPRRNIRGIVVLLDQLFNFFAGFFPNAAFVVDDAGNGARGNARSGCNVINCHKFCPVCCKAL